MKIKIRQPFQHPENYGPFVQLLNTGRMVLNTDDINQVTYKSYFKWITNFMLDGIETNIWHGVGKVDIIFSDGEKCVLTVNDLLFNIIMWYIPVQTNTRITHDFLFWDDNITQSTITKYVNRNFLDKNRKKYTNRYLNNVIADCTAMLSVVDKVSKYLSDTINLYDDVILQKKCPEYYEALHLDISTAPLDRVKLIIGEATDKAVNVIKNSKQYLGYYHSLASNFRSGEALNKKQFGETYIAIGTKPDAFGDVIPYIINSSFINGGVQAPVSRFVESYAGIEATIISHVNVSVSGTAARLMSLNNIKAFLHRDSNYCCNTRNPEKILIDSNDTLVRFNLRYYSEVPNGVVKLMTFADTHLIGKTVYIYSPMTCASYARGQGICYRCYGDLAFVNSDINIGLIASTLLSSILTQRMLSAKHLLETIIAAIEWCEQFYKYFVVETDQILFDPTKDPKDFKIIIAVDEIQEDDDTDEDDDDDDVLFISNNNSKCYITEFILEDPKGDRFTIKSETSDKMYLSKELYSLVSRKLSKRSNEDEYISIDVPSIGEASLFSISVENSGLSKSLAAINNIIDKVSVTSSMNKDELLQAFIEALNNAHITLNAIHAEVILSNQLRSAKNMLKMPAWEYDNPDYIPLSLKQSLRTNPSPVESLTYQDIPGQINNPFNYQKRKASILDLNIVKYPQKYLQTVPIVKKKDDADIASSVLGIDEQANTNNRLIDPFIVLTNKQK